MNRLLVCFILTAFAFNCKAQPAKERYLNIPAAANTFLQSLSDDQRLKAQFNFDTEERYNWHYIPKDDRKGISFNELNEAQKKAGFALLHTALSDTGYIKATSIMQLENVLRAVENRAVCRSARDP